MVAKNNAINTIATIITKIGEISIEISVAILKNISDYEIALNRNESKTRKKLYIDEILKEIKSQNPTIDSKITKSITNILSALA
jgi:polyhydroxyalkanoate synthesis regulator phasin